MKSRFKIKEVYELNPEQLRVTIILYDYHCQQIELEFNGRSDEKFLALRESSNYPQGKIGLCEFNSDLTEIKFIENNYMELIHKATNYLYEVLCENYNFNIPDIRIDGDIKNKVALSQITVGEGARLISEKLREEKVNG